MLPYRNQFVNSSKLLRDNAKRVEFRYHWWRPVAEVDRGNYLTFETPLIGRMPFHNS